ncbi:MAG: tripartite tricarboxylate transporter substrate binding protein [Betaproteobacteria bacterium]|nr:tripartite tricarboxylate transporter substrate binding protein [Betaproteobacteria bacterium]
MNLSRRRMLVNLAGSLAAMGSSSSWSQAYPSRPIRIVVPYSPGGPVDVTARILAEPLGRYLRQSIVVDNRAGGNAAIGTEYVARSAPDGYTLLMAAPAHTSNPSLMKSLSFDTAKDFTGISCIMDQPLLIAVHSDLEVNTLDELLAKLRANPGKFNYGTSGAGGPQHLMGEMFKTATGTQITHIPYKGAAPASVALLAGETQVAFSTPTNILPHIKTGKLKVLAVSNAKRSPFTPDIPTLAELGVTGFNYSSWTGLLAPTGTPKDVIQKLYSGVLASLAEKEVKDKMFQNGIQPLGTSPEEFAKFLALDFSRTAKIISDSGVKAQ